MHSHLHTPYNANCEEIMTALDECHARGFLHKALGNCNDIKRDVNKCLSAERWARAKRNREQAREGRRRIEGIWREEREFARGNSVRDAVVATASAESGSGSEGEGR